MATIKYENIPQEAKEAIVPMLHHIRSTLSYFASRAVDDFDNVIGILAAAIAAEYDYSIEEIKESIDEQFENF